MSESRKSDHIDLTYESRPTSQFRKNDFYYEPLFSSHPVESDSYDKNFIDFEFKMPLWVSSMTGGTARAKNINANLARACGEFGFGMGLGSCRSLLDSDDRLSDFDVKHLMPNMPLYANFGISQIEQLLDKKEIHKVWNVCEKLNADGVIVHVNPLQEWAQPEGDLIKTPIIETLTTFSEICPFPLIVKEVGQGFGPKSLNALCMLPLKAIEFASYGGTNFTLLEDKRKNKSNEGVGYNHQFSKIGHSAEEMIGFLKDISKNKIRCKNFIISGGVSDALYAHYLLESMPNNTNSVVGMASALLKYSTEDYETLKKYILNLKNQFNLAKSFYTRG